MGRKKSVQGERGKKTNQSQTARVRVLQRRGKRKREREWETQRKPKQAEITAMQQIALPKSATLYKMAVLGSQYTANPYSLYILFIFRNGIWLFPTFSLDVWLAVLYNLTMVRSCHWCIPSSTLFWFHSYQNVCQFWPISRWEERCDRSMLSRVLNSPYLPYRSSHHSRLHIISSILPPLHTISKGFFIFHFSSWHSAEDREN